MTAIGILNPVHPSVPHVSALRTWHFACALAGMGHAVSYFTGQHSGGENDPPNPDRLQRFELPGFDPDRVPTGAAWMRRPRTAYALLQHGGFSPAWTRAILESVAGSSQRPQVLWCSYGRMESVFATQMLARHLNTPWVLDLKDNPDLYVPGLLRAPLRRAISGWSALTSNAQTHAAHARRWLGADPHVVYSGVDAAFLLQSSAVPDTFVINVVGSLYFRDRLDVLIGGIAQWAATLDDADRTRLTVRYVGADGGMFEDACKVLPAGVDIDIRPWLPAPVLAGVCRQATVNAYVVYDHGFHHKLLELLGCGRPVLTYPAESSEAQRLAGEVGARLLGCADQADVVASLASLRAGWKAGSVTDAVLPPMGHYTWEAQAKVLEKVLDDAL